MKTLFVSCLALLLSISIFAQDDWCTCMETESSYENVSNYVSSSQNKLLLVSSISNRWTLEEDTPEEYSKATELPPRPTTPEPKVKPNDTPDNAVATLPARTYPDRSAFKKRKRLFAKRLKKRKRARRYRGKCPSL